MPEEYPKLERQPLTLVLAEFRYSQVADFSGGMFALHDRLQESFPESSASATQQVQVGKAGIRVDPAELAWDYVSSQQGRMLRLEPRRLVYLTTKYPRFPKFAEECVNLVSLLLDAMEPERLLRVGLRYNDAVVPEEGESLADYLDERLLPSRPLVEMAGDVRQHRMETTIQTNAGRLAVRSLQGRHGYSVMPDIVPHLKVPAGREIPEGRQTAVLDFDHYWLAEEENEVEFTAEVAGGRLNALHKPAREAFWRVTTDFAKEERWS